MVTQSVPEEFGGAKAYNELNTPVRDVSASPVDAPKLDSVERDYLKQGRDALSRESQN